MAEHDEIIALLLLFIAVFAGLLLVNSAGLTGMVVAEVADVQTQVEGLADKLTFLSLVEEANICLIINMGDSTTYSFNIDQVGTVIDVSPAEEVYCDGLNAEDFVFSYVNYEAFLEHSEGNPTLDDFKATGDGTNYYVLPSKFVERGMTVKNKEGFESQYGLLFGGFSAEEREAFLTNPAAQLEQRQAASGFPTGLIFGGIVLIVGAILLVILAPKMMKKPDIHKNIQLIAYIKSAVSKGYTEENVKKALIGSGWPEKDVMSAIDASKLKEETKQANPSKPAEEAPKEQAKA
ncbi:hypothetical protein ACFLZ7_02900 [Nanoarchaeota archaeon]